MKPILFNTEMVRAILDGRKTVTRRVVKLPSNVKKQSDGLFALFTEGTCYENNRIEDIVEYLKQPYKVNDILYVRETWHKYTKRVGKGETCHLAEFYGYKASITNSEDANEPWKPSIHMPKEAARIFLKVTGVRVERLCEITEEQAKAEGVAHTFDDIPDAKYTDWTKRIGLYPKSKEEWGYKNYLWHGNFGECGSGNWQSDLWEYQYSEYDKAVGSFFSLWNSLLKKDQLQYYGFNANPYVWVIEFEVIDKAAAMDNDKEKGGAE